MVIRLILLMGFYDHGSQRRRNWDVERKLVWIFV
jgi:hypothetical protein